MIRAMMCAAVMMLALGTQGWANSCCGGHDAPQAAPSEAADAKPQTVCPVMGGKIDKSLYADRAGKRVYFCCKGCLEPFGKDPAKYIAKLEGQGITLAKAGKPQTVCPVMGGKIDKAVYTDHAGKRVYFCCEGCEAPFRKDPAKYLKKLEASGVVLEDAPAREPAKKLERLPGGHH